MFRLFMVVSFLFSFSLILVFKKKQKQKTLYRFNTHNKKEYWKGRCGVNH